MILTGYMSRSRRFVLDMEASASLDWSSVFVQEIRSTNLPRPK